MYLYLYMFIFMLYVYSYITICIFLSEVTTKKNAKLDVPDGGYNEDEDCINI
jgi:hypothetical protein